jgi:cysteine sulfinate desulfinase/cysteine desulfurase-like protein
MLPYMTNYYGNPHSRTHSYGWESEKAVEVAREVDLQENVLQLRILIKLKFV